MRKKKSIKTREAEKMLEYSSSGSWGQAESKKSKHEKDMGRGSRIKNSKRDPIENTYLNGSQARVDDRSDGVLKKNTATTDRTAGRR